ncbi:ComEA family DNA-binding protein, partial [Bordetella pertussis]|uniref:ComEA family DNA-binding protein n=1 Tax=Bordetella pertussis TaxID=520 RepID=UPI0021CB94CD
GARAGGQGAGRAQAGKRAAGALAGDGRLRARGVGPRTARVIIEERQRGGRFLSLEDLSERVSGIGHKKMQSLQAAGLTAGPAAPAAGARPEARPAGGPRAKAAAGR